LNGFVSGINVSISRNEELTNAIVTLRKKNIKLYGDSYLYVHETVAQVWQMLEDACIPEHEHEAWLEFV
jgi:4-alpha-glucanotransferase